MSEEHAVDEAEKTRSYQAHYRRRRLWGVAYIREAIRKDPELKGDQDELYPMCDKLSVGIIRFYGIPPDEREEIEKLGKELVLLKRELVKRIGIEKYKKMHSRECYNNLILHYFREFEGGWNHNRKGPAHPFSYPQNDDLFGHKINVAEALATEYFYPKPTDKTN